MSRFVSADLFGNFGRCFSAESERQVRHIGHSPMVGRAVLERPSIQFTWRPDPIGISFDFALIGEEANGKYYLS